ncbi:50S ribosomal protein L18e [Thermogymnomonas acidicola]|uniref:Large ribosomal subunit protein eL18 n=1 Tax=Thermogymnomonas acidicola TaxID=399579 RepID=A0AA37BRD3_9ARCH|nr:50S ribosomal protein L18e [Thermogymnomonas acidicola]GGM73153.1 50S ribosomal protein L18e [Thermogymnomonas acidicola]
MSVRADNKESPVLRSTVDKLLQASRESGGRLWRDIARRLTGPRRNYSAVNLAKLDRLTSEGDVAVVPGAVLGTGRLTKKITVAGFKASASARRKIEEAGGRYVSLEELASENPKGTGIKIIG